MSDSRLARVETTSTSQEVKGTECSRKDRNDACPVTTLSAKYHRCRNSKCAILYVNQRSCSSGWMLSIVVHVWRLASNHPKYSPCPTYIFVVFFESRLNAKKSTHTCERRKRT